ncbi:pilus assembly PilX N-terminal domain-containing protein [Azotobacter chroococcum]|uniref:Type 4 fimbrial biogenesis protein PilX N-terminal domain-containing protein n=1 Tax=Azotobacter chroococcum NCIMB 8003 TaxID=1328314 RepID=A0A0C4WK32_9GAMM|nr:pilus assembly PilX N-terminal domain-containing protein [Azotobacter chroococcum]AJE20459.1 Hypothetical protein Achr_9770 [Azotobacter chroococcum NCIMB 8003]
MRVLSGYGRQTGATLVVGLIMLLLFTLMVSSSFVFSTTNLKAVGNMQSRDESIAAANKAIEYMLSTPFTSEPGAEQVGFDVNNDGVFDYTVSIVEPECIQASLAGTSAPSSVTLPAMSSSNWNTIWEIRASVSDPLSGANTLVRSGVRVLLTKVEKDNVCP